MEKRTRLIFVFGFATVVVLYLLALLISFASVNKVFLLLIVIILNILNFSTLALLKKSNLLIFAIPNFLETIFKIVILSYFVQNSRPGILTEFIWYYLFWVLFIIQFTALLLIKKPEYKDLR